MGVDLITIISAIIIPIGGLIVGIIKVLKDSKYIKTKIDKFTKENEEEHKTIYEFLEEIRNYRNRVDDLNESINNRLQHFIVVFEDQALKEFLINKTNTLRDMMIEIMNNKKI